MAEETESGASLLARREYARAVPLLKREQEKYPSNPRIRLQYADALSGAGMTEDAITQYEATAKYYEDNGLTVQAIAVRKKAEKARDQLAASAPKEETAGKSEPLYSRPVPKSALFEVLTDEEREALGTISQRARVGHRAGRLQPVRHGMGLSATRPRPVARLPLE